MRNKENKKVMRISGDFVSWDSVCCRSNFDPLTASPFDHCVHTPIQRMKVLFMSLGLFQLFDSSEISSFQIDIMQVVYQAIWPGQPCMPS